MTVANEDLRLEMIGMGGGLLRHLASHVISVSENTHSTAQKHATVR